MESTEGFEALGGQSQGQAPTPAGELRGGAGALRTLATARTAYKHPEWLLWRSNPGAQRR